VKSRHRTLAVVLWTAAATLGTSLDPGTAHAQQPAAEQDTIYVSLADARRLALERGPDYLPETGRVAFAEGELRSARTYPLNPEADADLFGLADDALERPYELRFSQGVEWPGRRGLRIEAAQAGLSGAAA
jgi:hypothetical protein